MRSSSCLICEESCGCLLCEESYRCLMSWIKWSFHLFDQKGIRCCLYAWEIQALLDPWAIMGRFMYLFSYEVGFSRSNQMTRHRDSQIDTSRGLHCKHYKSIEAANTINETEKTKEWEWYRRRHISSTTISRFESGTRGKEAVSREHEQASREEATEVGQVWLLG